MTHAEYIAQRENNKKQYREILEKMHGLDNAYIEERRMINAETDVIFEGKKYWFTGNCEIDANGNLLYELDGKSRFLLYKLFEDFEVVE